MQPNSLPLVLRDTVQYEAGMPTIKQAFLREDCTVIEQIICETQVVLYTETCPLRSKLLGLRLIKDLLVTASYSYFLLSEMLILPWIAEAARFKHDLPLEERIPLLFAEQAKDPTNAAELIPLGKSIIRISVEIVMGFAGWVIDTPYQNQPFPTLFQVQLNRLKVDGVQLPARFTFFKEEERAEYLACYQSKLKLRQQITSAYTASIRQRLINLLEGINSRIRTIPSGQAVQEKHFIQGLIYTGDNHVISTVIDICRQMLSRDNASKTNTTAHILDVIWLLSQFLDWMFCVTDPQIIYEIRTKIIPVLLRNAALLHHERENLGLRRRSMLSLQKYSRLIRMIQKEGLSTTGRGMFHMVDRVVEREQLVKFQDLQILTGKNLARRESINRAKAVAWLDPTREELEFLRQFSEQLDTVRLSSEDSISDMKKGKKNTSYTFPEDEPKKLLGKMPMSQPQPSMTLTASNIPESAVVEPIDVKWKKEAARQIPILPSSAIVLPEIVPMHTKQRHKGIPEELRLQQKRVVKQIQSAATETVCKKDSGLSMGSLKENSIMSGDIHDHHRDLVINSDMKVRSSGGYSVRKSNMPPCQPNELQNQDIVEYVPKNPVQFSQQSFLFFEDSFVQGTFGGAGIFSLAVSSRKEDKDQELPPNIEPQKLKPEFAFDRISSTRSKKPQEDVAFLATPVSSSRELVGSINSKSSNEISRSINSKDLKASKSSEYEGRIQQLSQQIIRYKTRQQSYKQTISDMKQHPANSSLNK